MQGKMERCHERGSGTCGAVILSPCLSHILHSVSGTVFLHSTFPISPHCACVIFFFMRHPTPITTGEKPVRSKRNTGTLYVPNFALVFFTSLCEIKTAILSIPRCISTSLHPL